MTPTDSIQSTFLDQVRRKLPPNHSFVDELAELLSVSRDSAYRRIRGETVLSLDEIRLLTDKYGISLDEFLSPSKERISFQLKANFVDGGKWLKSVIDSLEIVTASPEKEKELIYDSKDLPIFHFFQYPRLAAFKIYFWMKTFSAETKFNLGKYDAKLLDKKLLTMGEKIWEKYSQIPSTEIVTYEFLNVTLRQIEYAHECGSFNNAQEAIDLCEDCSLLVNHLKHQAEIGSKLTFGSKEPGGKFSLYLNEVLLGSNTILLSVGSRRIVFITPNNFNLLMTTHESFCQITVDHINNMINKSVLISVSAGKERSKFFNRVSETIQIVKDRLV